MNQEQKPYSLIDSSGNDAKWCAPQSHIALMSSYAEERADSVIAARWRDLASKGLPLP